MKLLYQMSISFDVADCQNESLNTVRGYSVNSKLELVLWHRPQRRLGLWKEHNPRKDYLLHPHNAPREKAAQRG